jgi:hypothetical protein
VVIYATYIRYTPEQQGERLKSSHDSIQAGISFSSMKAQSQAHSWFLKLNLSGHPMPSQVRLELSACLST